MSGQNSNTQKEFNIKSVKPRYINITEDIFLNLTPESLKLYMALRFEADYAQECSSVKKNIQFLINKTKISRRQVFYCLKELETCGLIYRESEKGFQSIYWVAQDYGHFKKELEPVHEVHRVVHDMHGVVHEVHDIITNTSTNVLTKESITFSNTKESEKDSVFEAAQECLENTKNNLPATTSDLKPNNYRETNYPVKKEQAISILMAINCLDLSEEFLKDLIKQRKAQGASTNERALKAVYKELIKLKELGFNLDECLDDYANSSWKGFKAEYFINNKSKKSKIRHQHDNSTDWINGCDFSGAI